MANKTQNKFYRRYESSKPGREYKIILEILDSEMRHCRGRINVTEAINILQLAGYGCQNTCRNLVQNLIAANKLDVATYLGCGNTKWLDVA